MAQGSCLSVVPVTGLDRGATHHATVQDYSASANSGAALRVSFGQARGSSSAQDLALGALQLAPCEVDLILDVAAFDPAIADVLGVSVAGVLNGLAPSSRSGAGSH